MEQGVTTIDDGKIGAADDDAIIFGNDETLKSPRGFEISPMRSLLDTCAPVGSELRKTPPSGARSQVLDCEMTV